MPPDRVKEWIDGLEVYDWSKDERRVVIPGPTPQGGYINLFAWADFAAKSLRLLSSGHGTWYMKEDGSISSINTIPQYVANYLNMPEGWVVGGANAPGINTDEVTSAVYPTDQPTP